MRKSRMEREKYHKVKKAGKGKKKPKWENTSRWGYWHSFKYKKNDLKATYQESPEGKFKSAEMEAHRLRLDFQLPKSRFLELVELACFYCGVDGPGIVDRKQPSLGFTETNVVPCCENCRKMKGTMDKNTFVERIGRISAHIEENPNIF